MRGNHVKIFYPFVCPLYTGSFENIHPFSKHRILLNIPLCKSISLNFIHNKHVKTDFKELTVHSRNILRYFCIFLYMRCLGIVHQKLYSWFHITHKHLCKISSESDNFCDRYHATYRQTGIQTPKTFQVQYRASLTFRWLII